MRGLFEISSHFQSIINNKLKSVGLMNKIPVKILSSLLYLII